MLKRPQRRQGDARGRPTAVGGTVSRRDKEAACRWSRFIPACICSMLAFTGKQSLSWTVVKLWNNRFVWLIYSLIKMMHACSVCSHMRFFHSGDPNKTKVRPCDASSALTPAASRGETPHPPGTLPPPSAFPGCSTYLEETFPQTAFCF